MAIDIKECCVLPKYVIYIASWRGQLWHLNTPGSFTGESLERTTGLLGEKLWLFTFKIALFELFEYTEILMKTNFPQIFESFIETPHILHLWGKFWHLKCRKLRLNLATVYQKSGGRGRHMQLFNDNIRLLQIKTVLVRQSKTYLSEWLSDWNQAAPSGSSRHCSLAPI